MQRILQDLEKRREDLIKSKINTSFSIITNKNNSQNPKLQQEVREAHSQNSPQLMNLQSVLKKDKTFAEDAKLRLSIEDYKLMCKNKILKKMMAKVLNTDVASLTAICKNIVDDVNKYIDLSLKTNKEKTKAKISPIKDLLPSLPPNMKKETLKLFHLPEEIIKHITHDSLKSLYESKYKYKLVDGIPEYKLLLYPKLLLKNPRALYFLIENNIEIDYYWLSSNTNPIAIELLMEEINVNPNTRIDWAALSRNPEAIKILKANRDEILWGILSFNTNPEAMKLIEEEIKVNPMHINFEGLAANETSAAIKLIEDNLFNKKSNYNTNWYRFWQILSRNSKAIKLLKANRGLIDWCELCGNQSTEAIKLLEEEMIKNPDIVNWNILSSNPNKKAFAILEANPNKINYRRLSSNSNPKAIKLLDKRMEIQNDRLSKDDKIDWTEISKNPGAIDLIKKRIIYEENLSQNIYTRLNENDKLRWSELSINPCIFELV
jgi:hypothetical protein